MSNKKDQKKAPQGRGGFGPGMGGRVHEKPKDFKATMKKLLNYLSPYKFYFLLMIVVAIGSTLLSVVGPKVIGKATTEILEGSWEKITGTGDGIDFEYIAQIVIVMLILYIVSSIFMYFVMLIMTNISQKVSYNLRKEISQKFNRLPISYYDKKTHGEVLSRVTNDVDTIANSLNQSLSQIITSVITIIGILIMMLTISVTLTIISLIIIPISGVAMAIVAKKSQQHFKDQQKFLGEVNGQVEEAYSGHVVMKAFNAEGRSLEQFEEANDKLYGSAWRANALSGLMMPIMTFIGNIGYVAVAVIGGYLSFQGAITVGDIQAFISYVKQFTYPMATVAQIANIIQSTVAAAERVFEFLEEEEETPDTANPVVLDRVQGNVEFRNVHFGYTEEQTIINNFSTVVKPGQKIAIVGPTGAGKTTIVKLLMRFYDINSGQILVDGVDIKDMKRSDLRNAFGMVLQDTWLYNGSIMENIRYGRLDATDEEVIEAARAAHADHFIRTLPEGYNTEINEDATNISQGQKQLLTIARAILANPSILILDEATSSVDTRTELIIQNAMIALMGDKTSFIIAHRLSTIRDADSILVMDKGDIVEQGNHEALLAAGGFYANLYNSQFDINSEEL